MKISIFTILQVLILLKKIIPNFVPTVNTFFVSIYYKIRHKLYIENIVKKIKNELGLDYISATATGGMGEIIAKEVSCITRIDRLLTLEGLKKLYEINKKA